MVRFLYDRFSLRVLSSFVTTYERLQSLDNHQGNKLLSLNLRQLICLVWIFILGNIVPILFTPLLSTSVLTELLQGIWLHPAFASARNPTCILVMNNKLLNKEQGRRKRDYWQWSTILMLQIPLFNSVSGELVYTIATYFFLYLLPTTCVVFGKMLTITQKLTSDENSNGVVSNYD